MLSCWGTFNLAFYTWKRVSQVALVVKNSPANTGDVRDTGLIPESGRSPGKGNGNPLFPGGSMDRGAWQTTVHRIAKSWTRLKWLSTLGRDHGGGKCWHFIDLFLHPLIQWAFGWTVLCSWRWTGHWGNGLQWNTVKPLSPRLYCLVSGGLGREWERDW